MGMPRIEEQQGHEASKPWGSPKRGSLVLICVYLKGQMAEVTNSTKAQMDGEG